MGSFLLEFPDALDTVTSCMWLLDSEAAKLSTPSLVIKVPAHIKVGEMVKVSTDTGEFMGRA